MEKKIDFRTPVLKSLGWGLFIAGFSYSCSVTNAGIVRRVLPAVTLVKDTPNVKPPVNTYLPNFNKPAHVDTIPPAVPFFNPKDTTNYNKMILDNQRIGLLNDARMLDILSAQTKEISSLKNEISSLKNERQDLRRQANISNGEKENAYTWSVFQKTIDYILYIGIASFIILIIGIFILIKLYKKST